MKTPGLQELQNELQRCIRRPEEEEGSIPSWIAKLPPITRRRRLGIYQVAYFERMVESLSDDFEAILRILGEEEFRALLRQYLNAYPSRHPTLGGVGVDLPKFLAENRQDLLESYPFIADLARLEWAVWSCFGARDSTPFDLSRLSVASPEEQASLLLELGPSVTLLRSSWAVDDFWRKATAQVRREDRFLLIHRHPYRSHVVALSRVQYSILEWIQEGLNLGLICDRLGALPEGEEILLESWLGEWLASGVVSIASAPLRET